MVNLHEKVCLQTILSVVVQKLVFKMATRGHLGFGPMAKNPGIFARDLGANFFIKGS